MRRRQRINEWFRAEKKLSARQRMRFVMGIMLQCSSLCGYAPTEDLLFVAAMSRANLTLLLFTLSLPSLCCAYFALRCHEKG